MAMNDSTRCGSNGTGVGDLLQIFREGRGRTKSELTSITGLSRGTVSARVDALIALNLLKAAGSEASTGGRRPARIEFNAGAGVVLAIDLGATHVTVAVTDLNATILASETQTIALADGPIPVLDSIFAIGRDLIQRVGQNRPLFGVGIGLPSAVEQSSGRPIDPPIMPGWDRFDVPGYVRRHFPGAVLVDNDVNILALGEHALSWPQVDDLIFVKVATGLGAGIISGGQLQRGAQGSAGDIGFAYVPYNKDSRPDPVDETLGNLASGGALAASLSATNPDIRSTQDVIDLVRAGDSKAINTVRQAGRDVGEVLATLVNALNPAVVVIGGSIADAGQYLLAGVREVVYRRSISLATQNLQIVHSKGGETAGVLGAAILVTQYVLSPANVEIRVAQAS
jgi:predicted NBD/HSP70 family sugar kinase